MSALEKFESSPQFYNKNWRTRQSTIAKFRLGKRKEYFYVGFFKKKFKNCVFFQRSNEIRKIEGLNTLRFLRILNLSGNQIKSLEGIPDRHEFLEKIDLENNKVTASFSLFSKYKDFF